MSTSIHQINQWRQALSEHQNLEFKEARNQFDFHRLQEYCVAIANEGGDVLLLGIGDKPPRPVVGTKAHPNTVKVTEQLFQTLGFRVDVEEVMHSDGRVLVFHIPTRPRGSAFNLGGTYLMRSGEALVPMSEDKLRMIFAEGQPDWLEEVVLRDISPQKVVELLDTQAFFELLKLPYPTKQAGVIDRLTSEKLIDKNDAGYAIRRIGALLLAKRLELFPNLERKAARVVVYRGSSKLETRLDQPGRRGYAAGFSGLVNFIVNQLPQNEVVEDALRIEEKLVPKDVIRELVANALIHQDFTMGGASVMVEIYSDRVEISNPGEPLVPVERFIDGYQSRNERLAHLMRRFRICEEKGSGIDRVFTTVEAHQLPAPDFRVGYKRTLVTIFGPRTFDEMNKDDRVRACYQHCALKWVMSQKMTNQSLRNRFRLSQAKSAVVSQVISATIDAGLVKADEAAGGSKKYARYVPSWA